jgi:hypothetical protein
MKPLSRTDRWQSVPSEEDLSKPRFNEFGMPNENHRNSIDDSTFEVDDIEQVALEWPSVSLPGDENLEDSDTRSLSSLADSIQEQEPKPINEIEKDELAQLRSFFSRWPVRDSSWLTATTFTAGSAVFVINSFFLLLPLVEPGMNFEGEGEYAGPATSILGTLIFLVGSWVQVLEALNIKRGEVHGIGLEAEDPEDRDDRALIEKEMDEMEGNGRTHLGLVDTSLSSASRTRSALIGSREFIWTPSMYELRAYYLRNPMFIGALSQMVGAMVFAVATVTAIPGVMDINNSLLRDTLSLLPTLIGGLCFLVAGLLQATATQDKWYLPTPWRLEWHMGFWNSAGSLGFALAGGLPYLGHPTALFQATLATFWGSWSFLIGSAVQWVSFFC